MNTESESTISHSFAKLATQCYGVCIKSPPRQCSAHLDLQIAVADNKSRIILTICKLYTYVITICAARLFRSKIVVRVMRIVKVMNTVEMRA